MDKAEMQDVIVACRCQLPSICFIAFAVGTIEKHSFYCGCHRTNHKRIGCVAFVIGNKQKQPHEFYNIWREQNYGISHELLAPFSFHLIFKPKM